MENKQISIPAIASSIAKGIPQETKSWLNSMEYSTPMKKEFNLYLDTDEIVKLFEKTVREFFPENKDIIYKAVDFIEAKHEGQYRDENTKYYFHPMMSSIYCAKNGGDIDQFLATLLHDTLEDTETTEAELVDNFGEAVNELVVLVSFSVEGKTISDKEYYAKIKAQPKALLVKAVDRLSNIYSTLYTQDIDWKHGYFTRTRNEIIPLISNHHPEIAQEIEEVIQYLENNSISKEQKDRISHLGAIREKNVSDQVQAGYEKTRYILDGE